MLRQRREHGQRSDTDVAITGSHGAAIVNHLAQVANWWRLPTAAGVAWGMKNYILHLMEGSFRNKGEAAPRWKKRHLHYKDPSCTLQEDSSKATRNTEL